MCAGDEILADAALAGDEDLGGSAGRGAVRHGQELDQLGAGRDNLG